MKQDNTTPTQKTAPAPQVLTREQLKSVTGAGIKKSGGYAPHPK